MTGRDLIVYILQNDLEDEPIFNNGKFLVGFVPAIEIAVKHSVGLATVYTWVERGLMDGVIINNTLYIPKNAKLKKGENGND